MLKSIKVLLNGGFADKYRTAMYGSFFGILIQEEGCYVFA